MDIHIVEFTIPDSSPARQSPPLGSNSIALSGHGWTGVAEVLLEQDNGRPVFRYAAKLSAPGTFMSCWVSYVNNGQRDFAGSMVSSATHSA